MFFYSSPLMPPPVWYSNYKTDDCNHQDRYSNSNSNNDDCIRWKPPCYEYAANNNINNKNSLYDASLLAKTIFPNVNERSNESQNQQLNHKSGIGMYEFDRINNNNGSHHHKNTVTNDGIGITSKKSSSSTNIGSNSSTNTNTNSTRYCSANQDTERVMIERFLRDRQVEIIAIVEGLLIIYMTLY